MSVKIENFRIEKFGSCEYKFNDILLRDKEETLEYIKEDEDKYARDIERLWNGHEEVSLINLRLPTFLQLEYTYKCPLRYKYCYSSSDPKREESMEFNKFKKIIKKINDEDIFDLQVLGGEPLVLPKYLKHLLENVKGKYLTISTNGILINEDNCEWIINSENESMISLGVDGHNEKVHNKTRGEFNKLCESIDFLNEYNIKIMATTCVTRHNQEHIEDIIRFLIDKKFKAVQFLPAVIPHSSDEIKKELKITNEKELSSEIQGIMKNYSKDIAFSLSFKIPQKSFKQEDVIPYGPCTAGITSATIDVKGDLVLCPTVRLVREGINGTIENAFIGLKEQIKNKRNIMDKKDSFSADMCCDLLPYGQKCEYTR